MTITVNGERREVASDLSVGTLLQTLGLQADRVAVEVNMKILDRSAFSSWILQSGDQIEIISFIGGG
jgi:thiamine biosynthesis protein ThiS